MSMTRREFIVGVAGIGILPTLADASDLEILSGDAFGSSWRLVTDGKDDLAQIRLILAAVFERINTQMSPYLADSAVSRFNASTSVEWQDMPSDVCHVASKAMTYAEVTNGAFDPTVGPIVARYGFGPIKGAPGRYTDISVDQNAIRKAASYLTLDLCGIAKGFALDEAVNALEMAGIVNALLEVGGEVKAIGPHPDERSWKVAISDPTSDALQAYTIIDPGQLALCTSGHAVNGLARPISTSHVIDPLTGAPASTVLASVSVLAGSAIQADAMATALCAAGPVRGIELAERLGVSALFIIEGPDGPYDVMTGRFADHVVM